MPGEARKACLLLSAWLSSSAAVIGASSAPAVCSWVMSFCWEAGTGRFHVALITSGSLPAVHIPNIYFGKSIQCQSQLQGCHTWH